MKRRIIHIDFSQLESWLTAYFASDEVMLQELRDSLSGGYKVHALNAALIYDIDPADAKKVPINLQGQQHTAYDGGKRISHLVNYGGGPGKVSKTFWLDMGFATKCVEKLHAKYHATKAWREGLVDEVFGRANYTCPCNCGFAREGMAGNCPTCSRPGRPVVLRWQRWLQEPTNELRTPFGRRREYHGRRNECANAIAAQKPQSCGASIWYRTLQRLRGLTVNRGVRSEWCPPPDPTTRVLTGTYDSFSCEAARVEETAQWMLWTAEQPWQQLGNMRFPAEWAVGGNMDEQSKENPNGLVDQPYTSFTAGRP